MKAIYRRSFIAVAFTMFLTACVQEQIEKGAPELEDCMGVYFVENQTNAKDHTLEKGKDKTTLDFVVRRTDDALEAEVPYEYNVYKVVQNMAPGDTAYVETPVEDPGKFKFGTIRFSKGQKESKLTVSFDNLPTGERYMCSVSINDPQYAQVYGYAPTAISFSVQLFEWTKLSGQAIYRDAFLSDILEMKERHLETSVDIYERKDKKGYFRLDNVYSAAYLARMFEGDEEYEKSKDALERKYSAYAETKSQIFLDASDPDKVYFPNQTIGVTPSFMGDIIYIASDVDEVFTSNSNLLYGKLSEDGVITFPANAICIGMAGNYYFTNTSGKHRVILPGGKTEDYEIDLTVGDATEEAGRPVTFNVAKDVTSIRYKVFTGKVTDLALEAKLKEVASEGIEIRINDGEKKIEKTIAPEGDAPTGYYTLVACSFGGNSTEYHHFSKAEFGYVKPGDERKVEIYMGLHTDDQYASDKPEENFSSENSFRYWVRGKDITYAYLAYYPTAFYETYEEQIKKNLKSYGNVNSQTLKAINSTGLSGILGNTFKPGTSYTFFVYAENGYYGEYFTETITLGGTQDPMRRSYYLSDVESYEQPAAEDYVGTWIPVSVDIFGDSSKGRVIRGNWRAREVELSLDGDKVKASGLFPSLSTNPNIRFDIKDGLLCTRENNCSKVWIKDSTNVIPSMRFEYQYYPKLGAISGAGYFYETFDEKDIKERRDMFMGGFVHEDIIAFVDNRTELQFWALALGGYQKNSMGEETLQNIIGDAHGELILVRKGSPLLEGLEYSDSSVKEDAVLMNSLSEVSRSEMPQFGIIDAEQKDVDTDDKLIEFIDGIRLKTKMK